MQTATGEALAVALGIGLLIGLERERRKGVGPTREAAGIRTFALVALLGALSSTSGIEWLVPISGFAVAGLAALAYQRTNVNDPGLTTEIALLVTFGLGVLAAANQSLAAGSAVVVALVLGLREPLHAFATDWLSEREWRDAVLLAAAALIVLPLLPNRMVDPWGAINPQLIWRLTVVVLLINAAGYVSLRIFGERWGLPLAGLLGGFVSSAAVVAAMGRRARAQPEMLTGAVSGAVWSSVATGVQLAVVLSAINPKLLLRVAVPLTCFVLVAVLFAALAGRHAWHTTRDGTAIAGRAFDPASALIVTLIFAAMLIAVAIANRAFGSQGALAMALIGAFADTHAAAASLAGVEAAGALETDVALVGIGAALTANTVTKLALAGGVGGSSYLARVAPGLVAMVAALWLAIAWIR